MVQQRCVERRAADAAAADDGTQAARVQQDAGQHHHRSDEKIEKKRRREDERLREAIGFVLETTLHTGLQVARPDATSILAAGQERARHQPEGERKLAMFSGIVSFRCTPSFAASSSAHWPTVR